MNLPKKLEKWFGKHLTQKPATLLERNILALSKENDVILDYFNVSVTTGEVAQRLNRKYIGIEKEREYLDLIIKRLNED